MTQANTDQINENITSHIIHSTTAITTTTTILQQHINVTTMIMIIYLSIYIPGYYLPKVGLTKTQHARVQGDIIRPSPSVPCLFMGENTEEGLPIPIAPSMLPTFYEPQGLQRSTKNAKEEQTATVLLDQTRLSFLLHYYYDIYLIETKVQQNGRLLYIHPSLQQKLAGRGNNTKLTWILYRKVRKSA